MKCPKCKTEVNPKEAICPNCNTHLVVTCPRCGSKTRIGSSSCSKCSFVFVKFCESCGSANYLSATQCRKCYQEFKEQEEAQEEAASPQEELKESQDINPEQASQAPQIKEIPEIDEEIKSKPKEAGQTFAVFVDFINLVHTFSKFKDVEFKEKVILNIRAAIKIAFGAPSDFVPPNFAHFKVAYKKNVQISKKISKFKAEMQKFNDILQETLGERILYKIIIAEDDKKQFKNITQNKIAGSNFDVIVTNALYDALKWEMNLIKISPDAYKMMLFEDIKRDNNSKKISDTKALETISNILKERESAISVISVSAPRGVGKTYLTDCLQTSFSSDDILFLRGRCTALTQISPIGLVQDIFITLFNLSFLSSRHEKKLKEIRNILQKAISKNPDITSDQIDTLINLLYPVREDIYENIHANKSKTFQDLKIILDIIKAGNRIVMVVDDFDLIDETSYEFLKFLIETGFFKDGSKLILLYRRDGSVLNYINTDKLDKHEVLDVVLAPISLSQMRDFLLDKFNPEKSIPDIVLSQMINNAGGNFAYLEQALSHLVDMEIVSNDADALEFDRKYSDYFVPPTFDEILKQRFVLLRENSLNAFKLLGLASYLGGKFNKNSIIKTLHFNDDEFDEYAQFLIDANFIARLYKNTYAFKNNLVWTYIYDFAKNDSLLEDLGREFLNNIINSTVATPTIKALLAQNTGDKKLTFELWTQSLKVASYIGDIGLYITSQKQSFENITQNHKDYDVTRKNISERLGKLVYTKNPKDGISYLTKAINFAESDNNIPKVVELTGYLITSASIIQNYHGVIEAVDNILKIYKGPKFTLERALIKSRKLNALNCIGDWEEVVSIVNNEITPIFQEYLKKPKKIDFATYKDIYNTWVFANIALALAYTYQGNAVAVELLADIEKELFKSKKTSDKNDNIDIKIEFLIVRAFNYSLHGSLNMSDEILQTIVKDYSWAIKDPLVVSRWNFVDIVNKIIAGAYENIGEELFNAVAFANNCGDSFNKNMFKTFLSYVLLKEENYVKALSISKEQMMYFAEEKLALGALLSWYVSASATFKTNNPKEAINICENSLKIAQSSKINSLFFTALFEELLAHCYMTQGDFESAKMYNEMSIEISNENNIAFLQVLTHRTRVLIMREMIIRADDLKKRELSAKTKKLLQKTKTLAKILNIPYYIDLVNKEIVSFEAFCKLNNLEDRTRKNKL